MLLNTVDGEKKITPWLIWFLGAFFYFYENLLQVSPGVMAHDLMASFSIDKTSLSLLASFYFYAYAFIQIPAGILIDHYNIRKILLWAVLFCIVGCLLFVTASALFQASLGRFLIGLGSGFAAISSMKLAASWFLPRKFPFFVGLMITFGMAGSIVGEGPLAVLVDTIGWKSAILCLAGIGMVLFVLIALFVRENPHASMKKQANRDIFNGLKVIFFCRKSWLLAIYAGLMFAPTVIFGGLWGVPFIMVFYGIQKAAAAGIVSVLFLGWVVGGPLNGMLTEYLNKKTVMLYGTVGALISMILILYVPFAHLKALTLLFFLFGVFSSCFLPAFSLIKDIHSPDHSGVVLGFMNTANTLGGALGLSFIGFLFTINWESVFTVNVHPVMNYQIILSILPVMLMVSLLIMVFFIKNSVFVNDSSQENQA